MKKIFKKVINFIKEEWLFCIIYLLIIVLGFITVPYSIYTGGGTIDLTNRIELKTDFKEEGSFNLLYVKENRPSIGIYLLSYIFDWDRYKKEEITIDENDSIEEFNKRNKLYLELGNKEAIYNAYKEAGMEINVKDSYYVILYNMDKTKNNLETGDRVISIDGIGYNDFILEDQSYEENQKVNVKVLRDGKEMDCYGYTFKDDEGIIRLGISLIKMIDYDLDNLNLKFKSNESGSSGGMMVALAIYNRLVEEDITHGLKIAGTGTIDFDGNIGPIGGVKYKLKGAISDDVDLLLVAEDNYNEFMEYKEKYKSDIKIVKVSKFIDAVNYLKGLE